MINCSKSVRSFGSAEPHNISSVIGLGITTINSPGKDETASTSKSCTTLSQVPERRIVNVLSQMTPTDASRTTFLLKARSVGTSYGFEPLLLVLFYQKKFLLIYTPSISMHQQSQCTKSIPAKWLPLCTE